MTAIIKPVATLSRMGWVTDVNPAVDFMMAHWVRSDKRQNPLMPTAVYNLPWILYENRGNMTSICSAIVANLTTYFSTRYEDVSVTCNAINKNADGSSTDHHLSVTISFNANGKHYDVSRILATDGVQFKRFIVDNNEGIK